MKATISCFMTIAAILAGGSASAATLSGVGTYIGNAGIGTANGSVADSPVGSKYLFVSTAGSSATAGYGLGSETNGSEFTTLSFTANAGAMLDYFFNYVTSDGAGFSDYAYATLNSVGSGVAPVNIFNARTEPSGDTVPGNGLPAIASGVTLTPSTSAITGGAPIWTELGSSSGSCFDAGCGYTGWIKSSYIIPTSGTFEFTFGVTNWSDTLFDSGLAISGLSLDGVGLPGPDVSPVPLPAAAWMLLAAMGGLFGLRRSKSA